MSRSEVPQDEVMLFVFRMVIVLWLVWTAVGTIGYLWLAEQMGWDRLSGEAQVSIFLALTVVVFATIAGAVYGIYRLFRPAKRARP